MESIKSDAEAKQKDRQSAPTPPIYGDTGDHQFKRPSEESIVDPKTNALLSEIIEEDVNDQP